MNMLAIILVIGAVIGGVILVSHLQDKKRTEKLHQVADEMGLPFYPQGDDWHLELNRLHRRRKAGAQR